MDDHKADEIEKLWQAIRDLQTARPGGHATVARGQTRFEGEESFVLEGTGNVIGTLFGKGSLLWGGIVELTASLLVTAGTTLRGKVSLENDLSVKEGGKIEVLGAIPVILGKVGEFVGLFFGTGASIRGWPGGLAIISEDTENSLLVTNDGIGIMSQGGLSGFAVDDTGTKFSGDVYFMDLPTIENVASNVGVDDDGKFGLV